MQPQYVFTLFTPAEVEKITSLSTTAQRDWRRRQFLPVVAGHARFDAFEVAEIWVMKMLSDRGIGPQISKEIARWCAKGIMWAALNLIEAYEGDHNRTFEWYPEELRPKANPEIVEPLINKIHQERGIALADLYKTATWLPKADWLGKQIFKLRGFPGTIPADYFLWWADGSHIWVDEIDPVFERNRLLSKPEISGPVIILDLKALGRALVCNAERALVHVDFPTDEDGKLISPLEYGPPMKFELK